MRNGVFQHNRSVQAIHSFAADGLPNNSTHYGDMYRYLLGDVINGTMEPPSRSRSSSRSTRDCSYPPVTSHRVTGMEAYAGAHRWALALRSRGCTVKLIPPQLVNPCAQGNKIDAKDAEARARSSTHAELPEGRVDFAVGGRDGH